MTLHAKVVFKNRNGQFGYQTTRVEHNMLGRIPQIDERGETNKTKVEELVVYLGKFRGFTDKLAVGPRVERVNGGRERDGKDKNEQVSERQIKDECVRNAPHRLVATQDVDEAAVADDAHQEDDPKDDGNNERLWSFAVVDVSIINLDFVNYRVVRYPFQHHRDGPFVFRYSKEQQYVTVTRNGIRRIGVPAYIRPLTVRKDLTAKFQT